MRVATAARDRGFCAGVIPGREPNFQQGRPGVEAYERIKRILAEHEDDLQKAEGGNKAAGTRVRQAMQDVKNAAQEVRQKILDMRDTSKAS
ncbi:MAG: hypothetical protein IPK69_06315 [Phycisphaerales bacterium]|nr:MAG: hypothetical protein IPK69_06315 [Phycisphaerales bacterium]